MGRAMALAVVAACFALSVPRAALGQDVPAPAQPTEAAKVDISVSDVAGEKVEVQLRPGEVITGVVKGSRYEVLRGGHYVPAQSRDVPGAGIKIHYAFGLNGFLFVRVSNVKRVRFLGRLTSEEGERISQALGDEMRKAKEDRARAVAELEAKKEARRARKAREQAGAEGGPGAEGPPAAESKRTPTATKPGGEAKTDAARERALRIRDLLKRFPPEQWKPSRLDEIKKRAIILDIYPNEEERAFMDNYDLWLEGYEMWSRASHD